MFWPSESPISIRFTPRGYVPLAEDDLSDNLNDRLRWLELRTDVTAFPGLHASARRCYDSDLGR